MREYGLHTLLRASANVAGNTVVAALSSANIVDVFTRLALIL
jgi:hypothetical protein